MKTSRKPPPLDPEEPEKVSDAISKWGLDYVVLTSVDRDDLEDQGSNHFRDVIMKLKEKNPDLLVEALTPDFQGNRQFIHALATSGLDVYAHNIEVSEQLVEYMANCIFSFSNKFRMAQNMYLNYFLLDCEAIDF